MQIVIFIIVPIIEFISYFPQIMKLYKTKKADDISIRSWSLWVLTSLLKGIYVIIINDIALMFIYGFTLTLCIVTLTLSLYYQKKQINLH